MNQTVQAIKHNLDICETNILKNNKGFLDLLFIIYNNMVQLNGENQEVNQIIIDCLKNILSDESVKRRNAVVDYKQVFDRLSNILYTKVDEVN